MARSNRGTVAAVAVVLGVLSISACDGRANTGGAPISTDTVSFQFGKPEVKVHVLDAGDLRVQVGTDKSIGVERRRTGGGQGRTNRISLENSDLWLDDRCDSGVRARCDDWYVLTVPPGIALVVESGSSDVTATGLDGRLDLRSDHGDVRLEQSTGDLKIASRDGDISLSGVRGKLLEATAQNGDVTATSLDGQVDVRSEHGNIRIEQSTGDLKIASRDGDISLSGVRGKQLEANSQHGEISASLDSTPTKVDIQSADGDVHLTLPRGEERYRVDVQSKDGDVSTAVQNDPTSERTLRVAASHGDIVVGKAP